MALTKSQVREILTNADVPSEKMKEALEAIITGHTESIEALREERDTLRETLSKAKDTEDKLKDVTEQLKKAEEKLEARKDYDSIKEEYESFKNKVNEEKAKDSKEKAFKEVLKDIGISDKRMAAIIRVTDMSKVELDKEGKIKGADKLAEGLKDEWAEFITTEHKEGAETANPKSNNGGGKLSKDEIYKIADPSERQKAIAENIELFE